MALNVHEHLLERGLEPHNVGEVFKEFDRDGSGTLDWDEFRHAMRVLHNELPSDKMKRLFKVFDVDDNGRVDHREFSSLVFPDIWGLDHGGGGGEHHRLSRAAAKAEQHNRAVAEMQILKRSCSTVVQLHAATTEGIGSRQRRSGDGKAGGASGASAPAAEASSDGKSTASEVDPAAAQLSTNGSTAAHQRGPGSMKWHGAEEKEGEGAAADAANLAVVGAAATQPCTQQGGGDPQGEPSHEPSTLVLEARRLAQQLRQLKEIHEHAQLAVVPQLRAEIEELRQTQRETHTMVKELAEGLRLIHRHMALGPYSSLRGEHVVR